MFDVMYFKNGPLYVARAIAYDRIAGIDYRHKWTYLLQGDSRHTVFAAYEDLWNVLNRMTRQDVKGRERRDGGRLLADERTDMRTNEDTNVLVHRGSHAPFQDFTGLV